MSTVIEKIKELGLPTHCYIAAQHLLSERFGDCSKSDYDFHITSMTNRHIETKHTKHAQLVFGYIVQESIRADMNKTQMDVDQLVELAADKATVFLIKNPWNDVATEITTVTAMDGSTTEITTVKKKRGSGPSKRDLCIALYAKVKHNNHSRAELIALFVKELGLTPAGASTYVANCKSGLWK